MIEVARGSSSLIDAIVEKLVARFQPRRIYLFGSRARGDAHQDSDYDLLIEVDAESVATGENRLLHLEDFPGVSVEVHLRQTGELDARKDDPGRVDWDVVREGILLFAVDGLAAIRPLPNESLVRERFRKPPESLAGWLERATTDLELAIHLSSDPGRWKEAICFNSQQASEKFLKALIIARYRRPPRTHKLTELTQFLGRIGIDFGDVENEAAFLTPFVSRARYPDEHPITETDAVRALSAARTIERAARRFLPGHFVH